MNAGYHAMFVGLTTGTLVLAFVALTYHFWLRPKHPMARAAWIAAEPVALYAALLGTAVLFLAIGSGLMLRPMEAFLNSPITKNKILTSMITLVCWSAYLALRLRCGPTLWRRGLSAHFAYVAALAGFLFLITTNSIGGDISGIPSGYEQIAQSFGFRTRHALYFPTAVNVLLWIVGVAALVGGVLIARRRSMASTPVSATPGRTESPLPAVK